MLHQNNNRQKKTAEFQRSKFLIDLFNRAHPHYNLTRVLHSSKSSAIDQTFSGSHTQTHTN